MSASSKNQREIELARSKASMAVMQVAVEVIEAVKKTQTPKEELYNKVAGYLLSRFQQPYLMEGRTPVTCKIECKIDGNMADGELGYHKELYSPSRYAYNSTVKISQHISLNGEQKVFLQRTLVEESFEGVMNRQAYLDRLSENKNADSQQDKQHLTRYNSGDDVRLRMMGEIAVSCLRATLWDKAGKDILPQATVEYINSTPFHAPTAGAIIIANVSESLGPPAAALSKIHRYLTVSTFKDIKVFEKNIIAKPFQEPLRILLGDGYEEIHPKNKGKQMLQEEKRAVKEELRVLATEVPAERVEQISAFLQQRGLITR